MKLASSLLQSAFLLSALTAILACTNLIVSPKASLDGSSIVTYNADSGGLYGSLYHYPAADHEPGSMRKIYDWDSGVYLGEIKEAPHTYNVIGNVNEFGLVIAETTFGGLEILQKQSAGKIDYGSLIWVTLQRAKTAREAIKTIGDLLSEYGYASGGESFSIADSKEAWIMELIGKGEYELGAVWVARKVPDGYLTAHANQARIQTFPLDDPEDTIYSPDVISFARKIGVYPNDKADSEFSFSDVYDPMTFTGARYCEARVWSFYSTLLGADFQQQYLDYAQGYNLTNRMPLFIQAPKKVSVQDAFELMRSHYENTELDMAGLQSSDVGAYTNSVYRGKPLSWTSSVTPDGGQSSTPLSYFHERPIATPQTGWHFVAQSRSWMPSELSGLLWFGVDESSTTVRTPVYGSATAVPKTFAGKGSQDGVVPPLMTFSFDSAFYVFNLVSNWVYTRWDLMYPELHAKIQTMENNFIETVREVDAKALNIYQKVGVRQAIEFVTEFGVETGDRLTKQWLEYFGTLFVKYRDGYIFTPNEKNPSCGCNAGSAKYPQQWYDRIVRDTGARYATPPEQQLRSSKHATVPKEKLRAFL